MRLELSEIQKKLDLRFNGELSIISVSYSKGKNGSIASIFCKKHGLFKTRLSDILSKSSCPQCSHEAKFLSNDDFIKKAKEVHHEKYIYSKTKYVRYREKIIVTCPIHGDFYVLAGKHLQGNGCAKCYRERSKVDSDYFLVKTKSLYSEQYDYSKVKYQGAFRKVEIVCPEHGSFFTTPSNFWRGNGCPTCQKNKSILKNWEKFLKKFVNIFENQYLYHKAHYRSSHRKIEIVCKKHGSFWQTPASHSTGSGCPLCSISKGEKAVEKFLKESKNTYTAQYRIAECRNKRPLPFDFAIFEDKERKKLKCLIEYDGEQHYKICKNFKMTQKDLEETQRRDKIKTDYCLKNNIKLIRIPYWEKDNVEDYLRSKDV